jgi:hypothetical protein
MIRRDEHLPWRWLADRHDGALGADDAAEADLHLASGCARCTARDRTLRRLVAAVAAGPLERPPAAADRRARALFSAWRDAPASGGAVVGVLVADTRPELATSLRAGADDTRRLLWDVGGWDVDASVVLYDGRADLLGQVLRAGDRPDAVLVGEVRAFRGRRAVAAVPIRADGRFTFRGLACGAYVFEGRVREEESAGAAAPAASPREDGGIERAFVLPLVVLG